MTDDNKKKAKILFYDIYEKYKLQINPDGSTVIYSNHKRSAGKALAQWYTKDGYLRTRISSKTRTIHSIVAEACFGERPKNLVINHLDGNKLNNHPSNLEYCTIAENIAHAVANGLHVCHRPESNGHYIDGRTFDKVKYKRQHYLDNIEIYKARGREFYRNKVNKNKENINV